MPLDFGNDEDLNIFGARGRSTEKTFTFRERRGITNIVGFDESSEYGTIQEAINDLPPEGGEVFVKEGTYVINSTIVITKDNVSIRGNSWGVVLEGNFASGFPNIISASSKDNIFIENISFTNINRTGSVIALSNCNHCFIKNNKFLRRIALLKIIF